MSEKELINTNEFGKIDSKPEELDLTQKIDLMINEFKNEPSKKAEFENRLGRLLFGKLERIYVMYKDNIPDTEIKNIRNFYIFYEKILGTDKMKMAKNGFLAEFAIARSIDKDAGYAVYKPTEQEDIYEKIDLWVDLEIEGKNILPIQIKCLLGIKEVNFIDINLMKEINDFKQKYMALIKDMHKFDYDIDRMKKYSQQFNNVVSPLLLIVPSPGTDNAVFNEFTGKPDSDLGRITIYDEFKKRYMIKEEAIV